MKDRDTRSWLPLLKDTINRDNLEGGALIKKLIDEFQQQIDQGNIILDNWELNFIDREILIEKHFKDFPMSLRLLETVKLRNILKLLTNHKFILFEKWETDRMLRMCDSDYSLKQK